MKTKSVITIELLQALDINEALNFRALLNSSLRAYIASHEDAPGNVSPWLIELAMKLRDGVFTHSLVNEE